jgi:hypothetical protein
MWLPLAIHIFIGWSLWDTLLCDKSTSMQRRSAFLFVPKLLPTFWFKDNLTLVNTYSPDKWNRSSWTENLDCTSAFKIRVHWIFSSLAFLVFVFPFGLPLLCSLLRWGFILVSYADVYLLNLILLCRLSLLPSSKLRRCVRGPFPLHPPPSTL